MTEANRLHGRVPARVRVQFRSASSLLVAYSLNLSRGGMFIETVAPPEVGTAMALELDAGQGGPVLVQARVTWRRAVGDVDGPAGIGVEFDDVTDTLGASIDQLVAAFVGVSVLVFCPDGRERETLRRMLRQVVAAADVVGAETADLCVQLCDQSVDLLVLEADDDPAGAIRVATAAHGLASPIPIVALTSDDAVAERLRALGAIERIANPPPLADLSRAVVLAIGRPTSVGL